MSLLFLSFLLLKKIHLQVYLMNNIHVVECIDTCSPYMCAYIYIEREKTKPSAKSVRDLSSTNTFL